MYVWFNSILFFHLTHVSCAVFIVCGLGRGHGLGMLFILPVLKNIL